MGAKTPKRKSFAKDDTKVSPFKKGNFTPGKGKGRNSNSPNPFKNTNGTPQSAKKFNKRHSPKKTPGGNTPKAASPAIKKEPLSASKTPKVKEEFSSPVTINKEPIKNEPASVTKVPIVKQEPTSVKKAKKEKRRSTEFPTKNDEVPPVKKAQLQKFRGTRSLFGSSQNAEAIVAAGTTTYDESASKLIAKVKQESSSVTEAPKVNQEPTSGKKAKKVKRHSPETTTINEEVPPTKKAKLQKVSGTSSLFDSNPDKAIEQKTKEKAATGITTHEKSAGKPTVKERKKARSEKWRGVCKTIRESRNEIRRALQTKDISGLSIKPEDIKTKIDVRKKVPLEKMSKSSKAALGTYCRLYQLMTGIDEFPKVIKAPHTAEDLKKRIGEMESDSNITKSGRKRLRLLKKRYKEMTGQSTAVKSGKKVKEEDSAIIMKKNNLKNKIKNNSNKVDDVQQRESSSSEEEAEDSNVSPEESAESDEESGSENDADVQIQSETQVPKASTDSELEESENDEEGGEESDESNESDYDVESNVKADKLTKKMNDDAGDSSEDDGKSKKSKLNVLKKITEPATNIPGEKGKKKSKKGDLKDDKQKKSGEHRQKDEPFLTQNQKRYVAFVGNLPYDVTVEEIKAHFQKAGEVKHVRIPTEKGSNKPRGFAFVEVNDDKTYQKTLSMHQTFIKGRKINVSFTSGGKKMGGEKMKEIKAKNMKLQALRKQGKLTGSVKPSQKRAARRNKRKHLQTPQNND